MKLNDYQKQATTTDTFGDQCVEDLLAGDPAYVAKILGLVGEAGEVAEKYKKIIRDKKGKISPSDREELVKELGDVMWYIALLAKYLGVSLEDVASKNLEKLSSRKSREAIHGRGDNR
jgi:NTP pyrophosphatase (non-canonical NTP hydrolase)